MNGWWHRCGVGLVLTGCGPRFGTVEEACPDAPHALVPEALSAAVLEVDCVRRYLGLGATTVSAALQEVSEGQATWLASHPPEDEVGGATRRAWLLQEDDEHDDFTGRTPRDRVTAAFVPLQDAHAWAGVMGTGGRWTDDPVLRDLWLQPGLRGVGLTRLEDRDAVVVHATADLPALRSWLRPIAWPRDGDHDVPVAFTPAGLQVDHPFAGGPSGFPITWTFGAGEALDVLTILPNPLELAVSEEGGLTLVDEAGDRVPTRVVLPSRGLNDPAWLVSTVALVPEAPLVPGARYTAAGTVDTRFGSVDVETSFTTSTEGVREPADSDEDTD